MCLAVEPMTKLWLLALIVLLSGNRHITMVKVACDESLCGFLLRKPVQVEPSRLVELLVRSGTAKTSLIPRLS
jgi:hypothetical protein